MKAKHFQAILFLLIGLAVRSIRADVIVDNLDQSTSGYFGPIGTDSNTNDFLIGQEFSLPGGNAYYDLGKISLLLDPTYGDGNISVSIWNVDPYNNPNNEIAFVGSQTVTNTGNVDFISPTNIMLPSGSYYIVAAPTTTADNALVSWAYTSFTNWTGVGILGGYADTIPSSWENYSIFDSPQQLSVQATLMPATIQISFSHGTLTLSWPSALTGYVLESATNLATSDWAAVTNTPALVAGNDTLTNIWSAETQFFRLRQTLAVDNLDQPTADFAGPIGTDSNASDFLVGQAFTLPAGNYVLNKITLLLDPINGNGNISVSLWNVGPDDNPTNEIALIASQTVTNLGNVDFIPSTTIILPSGNYYVVAAPTTSADNALVSWAYTALPNWTGFGELDGYADTIPGSWENFPISGGPQQLSVQVTPVSP